MNQIRLGCVSKTNGRSAVRPVRTAFSEAAISSNVPPRCNVIAAQALRRAPGNRRTQCVVHFEYSRPIAKTLQSPLVVVRQTIPGYSKKLSWRKIAQNHVKFRPMRPENPLVRMCGRSLPDFCSIPA